MDLAQDTTIGGDLAVLHSERLSEIVAEFRERAVGDPAVSRAVVDLARLDEFETPARAAILAGALDGLVKTGDGDVIEDLLDALEEFEPDGEYAHCLARVLGQAPHAVVVPPVIARLAGCTDALGRYALIEVLAARHDRHPDVLAALLSALDTDPGFAALALLHHGDPDAIPHLRAVLSSLRPPRVLDRDSALTALAACAAIQDLGGTLGAAERALEDAAHLASWRTDPRAIARARPHRAAPRTPPNAPCPCGSGRKFKKCCRE